MGANATNVELTSAGVENLVARSRQARETMTRHITQNTVSSDPNALMREGTRVYDELQGILHSKENRRERLEDMYLVSDGSSTAEIDEIAVLDLQIASARLEIGQWSSTVPKPPRLTDGCSGVSCCNPRSRFRRHQLV